MTIVPGYSGSDGAYANNVLAMRSIGGVFDQASVDFILAQWITFVEPAMCSEWVILGVAECKYLAFDPPSELTAVATAGLGTATGDALPAGSACVISLRAGSGGRAGRGRIYLPGFSEDDATGSRWTPALLEQLYEDYPVFGTECASEVGWVPAIYSRTQELSRGVASFSIDSIVDSQRRRQGRLASA